MSVDELSDTRGALEALLREGYLDRVVRVLDGECSNLSKEDVEDAVSQAVADVLSAGDKWRIENPRSYLFVSAKRHVIRRAQRMRRTESEDSMPPDHTPVGRRVEEGSVYGFLKGLVERWENANVRAVTLVCLEAVYEGEPMSAQDVADVAGGILGRELSVGSVYQWKARGFRRLAEELRELGGWDEA